MLAKLTGAFLFTYFVSRALRYLLGLTNTMARLVLANALSMLAIAVFVFLLRFPSRNFALAQLSIYLLPQCFWLALDLLRDGRIARLGAR